MALRRKNLREWVEELQLHYMKEKHDALAVENWNGVYRAQGALMAILKIKAQL